MFTPEQLKGKIRNIAKQKNLSSQEILQMYLFERVLERLSKSKYSNNFVLKGGFLIASMIGIDERTTMDIDTTIKGLLMEKENIEQIVKEILSIDVNDGISFQYNKTEPIREGDNYNNFRIFFNAKYGKIDNPMKMDITTGDEVTPRAINYKYKTIFSGEGINVIAYNLETILAEKFETIISRNIGNTRARDYYDLYTLYTMNKDNINVKYFIEALKKTSEKRESITEIEDWKEILNEISKEQAIKDLWQSYSNEYAYANKIDFEDIIKTIYEVGMLLSEEKQ